MNKVGFSFGPEVPFHRGKAVHLAALLTRDTAQLEALSCHCLGVRVHFCTGSMATVRCPTMKNNKNKLQSPPERSVQHRGGQHRPTSGSDNPPQDKHRKTSDTNGRTAQTLQGSTETACHSCNYTFITEERKHDSPNREQSRDTSSSRIVTGRSGSF